MEQIENILQYTRKNKGDQWNQLIEIQRLINSHRIKSVFVNQSDEGFIANYIKYTKEKVCLNSIDDKHFKEFGDYENCTYLNLPLETVNIQKYELMHINTNHDFVDWEMFMARMLRLNPKYLVLTNTKIEPHKKNKILQNVFKKHYHIDTQFEDYNGTIILKYMS